MISATVDASPQTVTETKAEAIPAQNTVSAPGLILVFFLVAMFCWIGVTLGQHSAGTPTIWLSNGLLFGIVARKPRSTWLRYAVAAYFGDLLGAFLVKDPLLGALGACVTNSIEVFLSAYLLTRWFGTPLRLSRPKPLFNYLAIAVVLVPVFTSALSTLWYGFLYHDPARIQTWLTWYLGDALGMAIIAPLVFAVQEPGFFAMFKQDRLSKTLLVLVIPMATATLEFSHSHEPVIFLVLPALIYVAFRLGFPGTVTTIFLIACITIALTSTGHGPLMLATGTNLLHKIVVVQVFLAVSLFTAFPVAALLEERTLLEHSLQEREAQYRELANTDALTGQANRRAFDERLEDEWHRAASLNRPLAILSIDVDLFKSYNDLYGHIAGDDRLRHIATLAAQALQQTTSGRLYRLGGEEFAAIVPSVDLQQALILAERVRQAVFSSHMEHRGSPIARQTISIGVAALTPDAAQAPLSLLALSDKALYRAKSNGRNRCESAS